MSYIFPRTYREISVALGEGFAKVRDSINSGESLSAQTVAGTAYSKIQEALLLISEESDDNTSTNVKNGVVDPPSSIMNDLGSVWYKQANDTITAAKATSIASSLYSNALRQLNNHVVRRTGVSTITAWYNTYAFKSGDYWNSLFAADETAATYDSGLYFTEDFVDLSASLNVTIPVAYRA